MSTTEITELAARKPIHANRQRRCRVYYPIQEVWPNLIGASSFLRLKRRKRKTARLKRPMPM